MVLSTASKIAYRAFKKVLIIPKIIPLISTAKTLVNFNFTVCSIVAYCASTRVLFTPITYVNVVPAILT